MFRRKGFWIVLVIVLLAAAGGGYYAYKFYLAAQQPSEPTIKTAKVRKGDLIVSASGAGELVSRAEVDLGFRSGGLLAEVSVEVGDKVRAGDTLALLDDAEARKAVAIAELQLTQAQAALTAQLDTAAAERAVKLAEIQVAQAETNLQVAQLKLDELLDWQADESAVKLAQANLAAAQAGYRTVAARYENQDDLLTPARVNLQQAVDTLAEAQAFYRDAMDGARDWEKNIDLTREAAAKALSKATYDLEVAQANYDLAVIGANNGDLLDASAKVLNAQVALTNAQTGPSTADIQGARLQVEQARLAMTQAQLNLEAAQLAEEGADTTQAEVTVAQARLNLEAAQQALTQAALIAPFDGIVSAVYAWAGENVGAAPVVTLSDLSWPELVVYLDQTELDKIAVGYEVQVIFDALPEETFVGRVERVDPALVTVDGVPVIRGRVRLDETSFGKPQTLPAGLSAAVDVIGGRAEDALLVPVEALRELSPGQYAVFVMEAGKPVMRVVEVGLMDYTSAEILGGLALGDLVSTGVVETE
ncbi:MAG: efflux RND transporter periplasmic adaptor subunit [Anaerolineae bacterium]|nr:efflux RND transporter periplasmic adaptor subunit [Anaerolineae bacterium]